MSLQSVLGDSLALLSLALMPEKGLAIVTPLSVLGKSFPCHQCHSTLYCSNSCQIEHAQIASKTHSDASLL